MNLSDQELLCIICITASINVFAMNFRISVLRNVGGGCSSSVSLPTVPFHTLYGFRWCGNSWLHCCWLAAVIGFLRSASHLSLVPIFILEHESGIIFLDDSHQQWIYLEFCLVSFLVDTMLPCFSLICLDFVKKLWICPIWAFFPESSKSIPLWIFVY